MDDENNFHRETIYEPVYFWEKQWEKLIVKFRHRKKQIEIKTYMLWPHWLKQMIQSLCVEQWQSPLLERLSRK